ncbi:enoyl-CoA hydratase/isomerase family protein [Achromobacter insolitus]|uniref:enoyl-CoA hydratase/isomerase family protein n=1 Tax=Achromobacter TaxID=222 RepID=UPI0007C2CAC3|nr:MULTISPECIES: enoyl-CoA hydratase/isomerase family protein [Achromobacter]GLK97631.1 enoyl-CoA hydratase [Achromobacter xylosoxidans]APX76546.1 enoyl-CoA hydratase [Achromobacter insolitus]AXA72404.1 enoyl-CoA hydratase/isomerase family protein [Achromobacter insolitus]MDH3065986.1 enoyl-CoA hydratase/isomerase family protein [Achromobacter insolitus]MEB3096277.1 enoyl-CoA hydratase/isomerase family protein [Achromobacter sp. D10]
METYPMQVISSEFKTVLYAVEGGVATITLNRPAQRNALDLTMREELAHLVGEIRRDRGVRVVILAGAGGAFCSGGDISTMGCGGSAEQAHERMASLLVTIEGLITLDRPVIAAVDGAAYGAGLGLALTADLILASPRARFCLSFLRLGAIPDCATLYTLPRMVGLQRAKELAFSTREFQAQEARDMGIVFEIQPQERIHQRARQIALSMAELPMAALAITKRAFNASLNSDLNTMLDLEAAGQGVARSTDYHREAAGRFLDKVAQRFQWPAADAV